MLLKSVAERLNLGVLALEVVYLQASLKVIILSDLLQNVVEVVDALVDEVGLPCMVEGITHLGN